MLNHLIFMQYLYNVQTILMLNFIFWLLWYASKALAALWVKEVNWNVSARWGGAKHLAPDTVAQGVCPNVDTRQLRGWGQVH